MATKTKVNNMSEDDEKKMTQWIMESKGRRLLSNEKMAERYSVALSMFGDNQEEPPTKNLSKDGEAIAATDSSAATPPSEVTEPTSMEAILQDCDEDATGEKPVVEAATEFSEPIPSSESQDSPSMPEEAVSLPDENDAKQTPMKRVSSKQRRLS